MMDHDYWLMKGYDEEPSEQLFKDFCEEKALEAGAECVPEWIDEHEAELKKEFLGDD